MFTVTSVDKPVMAAEIRIMRAELAKLKNLGCFDVDMALFDMDKCDLECVSGIFGNMLILQAVYLSQSHCVRYVAYSPQFEKLEDNESIPYYRCIVHTDYDEDTYDYQWERVLQNYEQNVSKDWKYKSRNKVNEVIERANFKSPKFTGWKTKDNIAVLEQAKAMIQEREKEQPNK